MAEYGIRIHGRAGQGAKSAGELIAEAALEEGMQIQAYPEFGAEKLGAPVVAFIKVSDSKIKSYAPVTEPDCVVVIDPYLVEQIDVAGGLKEDGALIVNTSESKAHISKKACFKGKIVAVNATKIATEVLGMNKPNIAMLGAFIKATKKVKIGTVKGMIERIFLKKLGKELVDKNIKCLKRGYDEAK
jgi:pyruvate ferredoxin oxidoreductase gamma subunit